MGARFADQLLAMLCVDFHRDGVAHRASGDEQAGLFPENLSGALLEPIYAWIFTIDVVADFGFGHGAAHGRSGAGDGVAAEVNHATNSAKTSLEKSTPRSVRRSCGPSFISRPCSTKRWIGASYWSNSSGPRRMPSASLRPTKKRSSAGLAGVDWSRGVWLLRMRSTYSAGDSTFWWRSLPSKECASAPK